MINIRAQPPLNHDIILSIMRSVLLASVLIVSAVAQPDTCPNRNDHDIEIIPVNRFQTQTVSRECLCNISSTNCSWIRFADQENINSGIIESILMWDIADDGYGQYSCIEDHSGVVKSVLILPESEKNTI